MPTTQLEDVRIPTAPTGETIPGLPAERVRSHPDGVAVVHGDTTYTYRRLDEESAVVAAHLRRLGASADDRIGVFAGPSWDLAVGTWGILRAGSAYLPLSPDYPPERLRFMIEDSRASVVLVQPELRERLRDLAPPSTRLITLDDARAHAVGGPPSDVPEDGPKPHHLAYVIYTSGSTGQPKGVMIEHRSLANQLRWLHDRHGIDGRRRVLQKTPTSFDAAQWELLAPACGATVVLGEPGLHRDPDRIAAHIARHRITTLQCVPTLLQALLDTAEPALFASLEQIFSGGEVLSRDLALRCTEALPHVSLVNLYGPTECTINSSSHTVDPAALREGPRAVSIGTPAANTEYLILDERRTPVTAGEIGELYVGGAQLTRGYLLRPDLTADRFVHSPYAAGGRGGWLYRTGDLAYGNTDGSVQYVGRADTQVKLRGYRVELDEVRLRVETHHWVRKAAVVVADDPATGHQNLLSFIELDPAEAALMDQGNHGAHHRSKAGKLQVRAQLSDAGVRGPDELRGRPATALPGAEPDARQRALVFGRKTYRFFEGGPVGRDDVLALLARRVPDAAAPRDPEDLDLAAWGHLLRHFGQFRSTERLLPKYGYASPGSLYATQLHLEHEGIAGLPTGFSYYHPVEHRLVLLAARAATGRPGVRLHFTGRRRAIEPVYRNNIQEVLEIETGHLLGLFDEVLPRHGLRVVPDGWDPAVRDRLALPEEDFYLGSFRLVRLDSDLRDTPVPDTYVQARPGGVLGLPAGQYAHREGELVPVAAELVLKRDVIAINQEVYDRAALGISLVSPAGRGWLRYVALGRELQRLQLNDLGLGFMSSGYSSESGNPLPSARRIERILTAAGRPTGPSYFSVGGRVSDAQRRSEGMREDAVHMRGPAEMVRDDLAAFLPDYMVPNRVTVLDALPLTPNGKIDVRALERLDPGAVRPADRPFTAPRTATEERVAALWKTLLHREEASVLDDFFESGGNSLVAVALVNRLNTLFGTALPLQVVFASPTVETLARALDEDRAGRDAGRTAPTRLVPLRTPEVPGGRPVYCWPGLGGYPMNLRALAAELGADRPFVGVQAHGVNAGEIPYPTIREMAAADAELILRTQPDGPYTLWGYSFGARVAFETAYQLESAGHRVDHLNLIAPGSPRVAARPDVPAGAAPGRSARWGDPAFLTILHSVFTGSVSGPELAECLAVATDQDAFVRFVTGRRPHLGPELVRRVTDIVRLTYSFEYTFGELLERRVAAPVRVFKADGDDYSFLEGVTGWSAHPPVTVSLAADHYGLLREPGVRELADAIRRLHEH
ncbi:amino acid adenylation domain-containing protein [Streptomyces sp. NPDC096080]|uniref:non-ribosomal peptide synthetase family protein n=1 Tax=Streptomyces sp. NPDC096080 TaxID=3156693 RepID=UPI003330D230